MRATKEDYDALMPKRTPILATTETGVEIEPYDVVRVRELPDGQWEDYASIKDKQDAIEAIRLVKFAPISLMYRNRRFRIERRGGRAAVLLD